MRSSFTTVLLAAAIAHVQAIKITSPSKNDELDVSKGVTVEWSTVSTDPTTAHLVLVNAASGHTPYTKDLGEVKLSTGSITVTVKDVPADEGYQFNFESVDKLNTGILAQSEQFEVEASDDEDNTSSSTGATTIKTSATKTAASTGTNASATTLSQATISATGTESSSADATASATGTKSGSAGTTGTATGTAAPSASTGAAVGQAVQGGMLAFVAGVVALMA
jgi:hypothetical protein